MGKMWLVVLCLGAGGMTVVAQKPDIKAAQAAIMKADEDFNQSVADRNRERFLSLIADGWWSSQENVTPATSRRITNGSPPFASVTSGG